jgi:prepilin-type processing-associated H-X9-DG protein
LSGRLGLWKRTQPDLRGRFSNAPRGLFIGDAYNFSGADGPTALAAAPAPADIVMLIDGRSQFYNWYGCSAWLNNEIDWCYESGEDVLWQYEFADFIYATQGQSDYVIWRKHSGGTNVAFADGHSKMLRPGDLDHDYRWVVNPVSQTP